MASPAFKRKALTDADFPPLQNDLLLCAAKGLPVRKVPVWIMRQAGRYLPEFREARAKYDFFTICRTPELACLVTLQPIDRYGDLLDASIIFSDILVVPQALGLTVEMLPKEGPHFPEPLKGPEDLGRLAEKVDVEEALGYVFDAITLTRQKLGGRVPLFGFAGAPWTLMAYMIEGGGSKTLSKAKGWLYRHPEASHKLLQKVTDVLVDFLVGQVRAGAQALQVFDSWGGELSPSSFTAFSLPYLSQIPERVRALLAAEGLPSVPIVVFAKGAHFAVAELSATGYDVIGLDWTMRPSEVRKQLEGKGKAVQGNLDPCALYGDAEGIRREAEAMFRAFCGGQGGSAGWIANLGHGIYPDHDPEKLRAYLEAVHDLSKEYCK
ncbi:Uroporphyrinogen decarboxylase [Hyaloraphidium curvatum]|nr:Uroporphyrinogen decarboxylase [Hyaloraphidium curvatum]